MPIEVLYAILDWEVFSKIKASFQNEILAKLVAGTNIVDGISEIVDFAARIQCLPLGVPRLL